ncbi:hypothetical protein H477_5917 [[Clostridium] sordellii ATCC 9714]|nr:hypothetical protein H477_5917 [[Clostridium] sordellii ATCC 9714] [Paeniclostridium sordellii ATCC 9714]
MPTRNLENSNIEYLIFLGGRLEGIQGLQNLWKEYLKETNL